MPHDPEPGTEAEQPRDGRTELHPIVPYLYVIGLAALIGLFVLAYLWLLRDEIIAILRQGG